MQTPRPGATSREQGLTLCDRSNRPHNASPDRNVDHLEIVLELAFGEGLDTVILGLEATHHALPPPVFSNSLGDNRARRLEPYYGIVMSL
jgi:hypothetical protein